MMNNCCFMGRMVRDPEMRQTYSGSPVTSFTLAVERDGSKEKKTDFIDFVAWNGTAEFACKYFHRGDLLAVTGHLQMREYEDKQGQKRRAAEVIADHLYFAQSRRQDASEAYRPATPETAAATMQELDADEPIPF